MMKKITLPFLFISFLYSINAQITLTAVDMPQIGDVQFTVDVDNVAGVTVGSAGANQIWDFSTLTGTDTTVTSFVSVVGTPGEPDFPDADFAVDIGGAYSYVDQTANDLSTIGISLDTSGMGDFISVPLDPGQKIFEIPTTFGTSFNDMARFSVTLDGSQLGVDSIRITNVLERDVEYDGFGTVISPGGTFDGLREKVIGTTFDTTEVLFFGTWQVIDNGMNVDTSYNYYSQNSKGALVSVGIFDGQVEGASYQILEPVTVSPIAAFGADDLGDGEVAFTDLSNNFPTEWLWDFGDGSTSTDQHPVYLYAGAGTYNVCLTVTNSAGSDIICQDVTVNVAPTSFFTFFDLGVGEYEFTDQSTNNPDEWLWDFGDGNTSTMQHPIHNYASTGTYEVCLTVSNSSGSNTSCQTLNPVLIPVAAFSSNDLGDGMFEFMDESSNSPTSWSWDFGDGNTSTMQNPSHTYAENGTYTVCLTATNMSGSGVACDDFDVIVISTEDLENSISINTFPNPVENVLNLDIESEQFNELEIKVYNSLGQKIIIQKVTSGLVNQIQVGNLATGFYSFTLENQSGNLITTGKFIKQ